MITYVDTSAALKLVIEEAESHALAAAADRCTTLVSSMLLFTELHCVARRRRQIDATLVTAVLDRITLVDVVRQDLILAAGSHWGLRSADAIHLASALRIQADAMLTYNQELLAILPSVGITAQSPR